MSFRSIQAHLLCSMFSLSVKTKTFRVLLEEIKMHFTQKLQIKLGFEVNYSQSKNDAYFFLIFTFMFTKDGAISQ